MRFGVCFCICMSLAATSLSNVAEFSQTRDLPALKMAASELDTILIKARSIIDAANGPLAQQSGREGRYATPIGGRRFRRSVGMCLSMLFLTSLMISSAYCWKIRNYTALGMPICSGLGFLLMLLLPWNRLLPGFGLYQHYSPFFLIRHVSQISVLADSGPRRNSTVLFPFPKQAVAILFVLRDVFRISPTA